MLVPVLACPPVALGDSLMDVLGREVLVVRISLGMVVVGTRTELIAAEGEENGEELVFAGVGLTSGAVTNLETSPFSLLTMTTLSFLTCAEQSMRLFTLRYKVTQPV